ncbi:MAG: TetR/AcrR family transcriptional regulator [Caulobacterales bacterium]|uniref:TetR/AcrR family transcriptional regulator n=1 Tax=Glycocaulis sp. TaxID=1969725 RepID=UPI003FA0B51B
MRDDSGKRLTRRDARKLETHSQVIEAARRVFLDDGYERATIKAIADAAGVSAGTVLNVAPTKSALLILILRDEFEMIRDSVDRLESALSGHLRDRLSALVQVILEAQLRHEELFAAAIAHTWLLTGEAYEEAVAVMSSAWGAVERLVAKGIQSGELRSGLDAAETARLIEDCYTGLLRRARGEELDRSVASALMRQRLELLISGLSAR